MMVGLVPAVLSPSASAQPTAPGTTQPLAGGARTTAFQAVPSAGQSNISPYPVLQRLGRWDGTTFQTVAPGSIPSGHAVFLSHGWSPDYLASYQQLQADSSTLVTAWTPGLVNTSNQSMMDTWVPVAQALQTADPTATIVLFSWVDQSATGGNILEVRDPEQATEVNGHRFATAITEALNPDFHQAGGQVHVIGHSFGANVATTAALALDVPPRHLTLLDSPEVSITELAGAKNDLRYKLPRLDIGRGPGETFVDNYISYVGTRYGTYPGLEQIVDVKTAPPPSDNGGEKHSFAIVWYRTSAQNMSAGVGYAWSPLLGSDPATLGAYYEQPDPSNVLGLNEVNGPPPSNVATQMLVSTAPMQVPGPSDLRGMATGTTGATTGTTGQVVESGQPTANGVTLGGSAPTTWNLTFSTDETSLWLDFELSLDGSSGDLVSVFVDGRQRYVAGVPNAGTGQAGSFVILYDVTAGDHTLSVVLSNAASDGPPASGTVVSLSGLDMASTADIQRNLTQEQTDRRLVAALVIALVVLVLVIVFVIVFIVFVVRRLRHLAARHHSESAGETEPTDEELSPPGETVEVGPGDDGG